MELIREGIEAWWWVLVVVLVGIVLRGWIWRGTGWEKLLRGLAGLMVMGGVYLELGHGRPAGLAEPVTVAAPREAEEKAPTKTEPRAQLYYDQDGRRVLRTSPPKPAEGELVVLQGDKGLVCSDAKVPAGGQVEARYSSGELRWFGRWKIRIAGIEAGSGLTSPAWACVILRYASGKEKVTQWRGRGDWEKTRRLTVRNDEREAAQVCLDANVKTTYWAEWTNDFRDDGRSRLAGAMFFQVRVLE
jgi:hypothetical protein